MIIILEGVDGSGKTTLARQIQAKFQNVEYHHEGVPPKDVHILEHLGAVLDRYRGKNVVIDRFALGERVYGPVVRGFDQLGDEGWKLIKRLISATGAMEVLCLPSYEVCHRSWSSGREEMFKKEEQFKLFYSRYVALKANQYIYDYTDPLQLEHLLGVCNTLQQIDKMIGLPAGMVGSPVADYLFVGERGANPKALHDLPFFATVNSSRFLNDAIRDADYREDQIAFINAYKRDNTPNVIPRNFKTVIALGGEASAVCTAQDVPHKLLYHPQFWKRFHSSRRDEYVRLLRGFRADH